MSPELNPEQRAAVVALAGPVTIAAGAGSGKTRTLCERFVRATTEVRTESWEPAGVDEVLAITFTDKAAGEIAERIRATLRGSGRFGDALAVDGAWISTIHGLCSRLLRRYALEAGIDPSFGVADDVEAARLRAEAFEYAARQIIESDEGRTLFDAFRLEGIHSAVFAAASHSMVLSAGRAALAPVRSARPARALLDDAIDLFGPAAGDVAACGSPTATAVELERCCACALDSLAAIDPERTSEVEIALALVTILGEWRPGRRVKVLEGVQTRLSEAHQRLVLEALEVADAWFERALLGLTELYRARLAELKRERGVLDFDDLQCSLVALFDDRTDVLEECRSRFRLTMVDEFQDTDALQLSLIERLAHPDLCTVGDARQAIYGFRGADIAVYRSHLERMREIGARDFSLDINYRSHPEVLAAVNELFSTGRLFGDSYRPLSAGRERAAADRGPAVRVALAVGDTSGCNRGDSREREAAWVAGRMAALRTEYSPGEMVVLVRGYTHAEVYARALRRAGLEAAIVGGSRLFDRPEIHTVRALVRVIGNPHDEEALVQLLAGDGGRITDDGLLRLTLERTGPSVTGLWDALRSDGSGLSEVDAVRAQRFVMAIGEAREQLGRRPLAELVLQALERLDVDLLSLARGAEGRQAYANVLLICRRIAALEVRGVLGPAAVEEHLAAMAEYGAKATPAALAADGSEVVRIMSVHASKGLEFPVVAAVELDSYVRPTSPEIDAGPVPDLPGRIGFAAKPPSTHKALRADTRYGRMRAQALLAESEEATRLFYVACTRAEDVLLLSGAAKLDKPADPDDPQPISALRTVIPEVDEPDAGIGPRAVNVGTAVFELETLSTQTADAAGSVPEGPPPADAGLERAAAWSATTHSGATHRPPVMPRRVSYSDLALYESCKLRFFTERVLGLVRVTETAASPAQFGSAVHAALQLVTPQGAPDARRLDSLARSYRLADEERVRLTQAVDRYVASDAARRLAAHTVVRREWPFVIRLGTGDDAFELVGSVDAYGRSAEGGLVVDYKTGGAAEDPDLVERYRLQAMCYAAAAAADGCESVRVEFIRLEVPGPDGEPDCVAYDFDAAALDGARAEIRRRYDAVSTEDPTPLRRWDQGTCGECVIARTMCPTRGPR